MIHYKISDCVLEISWNHATSNLLTLSDIKELVVAVSNGMRYSNGFPKENKTFTFHVNTTTSFSDWRRVIGSYSIPRKSLYYGQAWLRSWSRYIVFTFMFGKSCGDKESIRFTVVCINLWTSNTLCFSVMVFLFYSMIGESLTKIENH